MYKRKGERQRAETDLKREIKKQEEEKEELLFLKLAITNREI